MTHATTAVPSPQLHAAIGALRRNETTLAAAARGLGIPRRHLHREAWTVVRQDVLARDASQCVRCARTNRGLDVHHRTPRGLGGTSDPLCAYGLANLITLCRDCHIAVESRRADALSAGWLLHHRCDPEEAQLLYRMRWQLLTHDGRVLAANDTQEEL